MRRFEESYAFSVAKAAAESHRGGGRNQHVKRTPAKKMTRKNTKEEEKSTTDFFSR